MPYEQLTDDQIWALYKDPFYRSDLRKAIIAFARDIEARTEARLRAIDTISKKEKIKA